MLPFHRLIHPRNFPDNKNIKNIKIWPCILLQRCILLLIHPWFLSTGFSGRYAEASSQMLLFLLLAKTNSASNAPNQFVLVYSLSSRSLLQRHSFLQLIFCQLQWLFIGLLTRQIMDFIFPVEQGAIRPTFLSLFCFWAATWWLLQLSSLFALNSSQEKLGWKEPKISKSGLYGTSQVALIWRRILFHKGDFTKSFLLLAFGLCGLTSHTVQVDDCAWRYAVDNVGLVWNYLAIEI